MKKSLKYLITTGLCTAGILASSAFLTSCNEKPKNISGTMDVTATAETMSITCSVTDPDSIINSNSIIVYYWEYDDNDTPDDTSDDTKSNGTSLKFTDLPSTDDDGNVESQTKTATGLKSNQDYLLKFYCTVGTDEYVFEERHVETNDKGKTRDNPIEITTAQELYSMDSDYDAYYKLMNDIDLTGYLEDEDDSSLSSIFATASVGFTGEFDGNGHTIKGFSTTTSSTYTGLFGYIAKGGLIENVTIESPSITFSRSSESYSGAFAAYNLGEISNCTVTGANLEWTANSTSGTVISDFGGFVGYNGGKITNSSFDGSITCNFRSRVSLGGFVGVDEGTMITNCTANAATTITSTSQSSSSEYIAFICGGFVGTASGAIIGSKSIGSITASYSFSTTNTEIDENMASDLGGFAGLYNSGRIKSSVANISMSFTSTQSLYTNIGLFAGDVSTGLTIAQLENNVVIGKNNTVELKLLDSNGNYNYDRNVIVDSETKTVTTDRKTNFAFINCLDADYTTSFYNAGKYSVEGEFTLTIDATDYVSSDYMRGASYTTLELEAYIVNYIKSILA